MTAARGTKLGLERANGTPPILVVDVAEAAGAVDLGSVDALARLCLDLRRQGRRLRVDGAPPELRDLLSLCGLADVVMLGRAQER